VSDNALCQQLGGPQRQDYFFASAGQFVNKVMVVEKAPGKLKAARPADARPF
jgi:hypothetical protein